MAEIGTHRKRVEDPRLLRGEGQYVDDLRLDNAAEVAFVRSAYAHARIAPVDTAEARRAPGVLSVWTGEQVRDLPRLPSRARGVNQHHLSPLPPLAEALVTLAGYPVAAVAATDRRLARDAADLIDVAYEPLPTVTSAERALEPDAPVLYPAFGSNVAYNVTRGGGDVDAAFAHADRSLHLRLTHSRLAQVPMEPRAIAAHFDRHADLLTVWRSTQSPFLTRSALSVVLGRREDTIRVIAPDVGGAFGAKSSLYPDELTTVLMAMELDRPVRWVSSRSEDLLFTLQGRDQVNLIDAAFTEDGLITGLKVRCIHNLGGVQLHPVATPPMRVTDYATGAYRIGAYQGEGLGVFTNTSPTGPYRGAGRPEAAFVAERTIEEVGRTLGLDPVEVRRRNFIHPDQFPYTTPAGVTYDSGDYERVLDRALELVDYAALRRRQHQVRTDAQREGRPLPLFDGQVAGGLTQGVGEALYERIVFADDGQLLTGSLLEYAVPTAQMVPEYELDMIETRSPLNPLGAKGIGESGCVSAPPAIVHAVLDALAPLGLDVIQANLDMPLTPEKIWHAIESAMVSTDIEPGNEGRRTRGPALRKCAGSPD